MRKLIILILCFTALNGSLFGQTGINTRTPHASSALDVTATDRGVLLPKYTLTSLTSSTTPVNGPAVGSLIYNTGGTHAKGYYYWDGFRWERLVVNNEMVQILNLNIPGDPNRLLIGTNTNDNYINFSTASGTTYMNTLGTPNPTGTEITLPAGTYKVDVSFDGNSIDAGNTNPLIATPTKHLYVVEAAIVNTSNALLTDLKSISDISGWGAGSIQGYSFSFVFKLATQQNVKLLFKNGSGATINSNKYTGHKGLNVIFYRMFE